MGKVIDELPNKIDMLLGSELKNCYNYSSIVMKMYKILLTLLASGIDLTDCADNIAELREYVLKEYDMFEKLLIYDKAHLIPKIDEVIAFNSEPIEDERFKNMLKFTKNIFLGYKISGRDLLIDNIPKDMRFDIYSAMIALIYIKTFKSIKAKLKSLTFETEQDELFANSLWRNLDFKILYRCCSNDLFEMISLFSNMDIDNFPDIDMNILGKYLSKIYYGLDVSDHINETLFNLIIEDITKMKEKKQLTNSPEDVFDYLYFTTKFNTIMLYMNAEYLQKVYNYCAGIEFQNVHIHSDIKRLVRLRIDIEK